MAIKVGLRGVVIAESEIASIDGKKGVLYYRGYNIKDFAEKVDALNVCSACNTKQVSNTFSEVASGFFPCTI